MRTAFVEEKKKKKNWQSGGHVQTQIKISPKITGNLGIKPAIGPPTSLAYSKCRIQLLFFSSANNIMREKLHHIDNKTK